MSLQENKKDPKIQYIHEWLAPGLVILYQLIALITLVIYCVSAIGWFKTPFLGAYIENTLFINAVHPSQSNRWPLYSITRGDRYQLIGIDENKIPDISTLTSLLTSVAPDASISVTLRSLDDIEVTQTIQLSKFSGTDQITYFYIPFLIGIVYLGTSVWVMGLRRKDAAGRAYSIFASSVSIVLAGLFDTYTTNQLTYMWTIALGLTGGSLLSLTMLYPQENRLSIRFPFLRWIGYLLGLCVGLYTLPAIYNQGTPLAYLMGWQLGYILIGIGIVLFIIIMIFRYLRTTLPVIKEQARLLMVGTAVSLGPICVWLLAMEGFPSLDYSPYLLLPIILFALVLTYTISSYRLLSTNLIFSRTIAYTLLTVIATLGYALLVTGLSLVIGNSLVKHNIYLSGIILFLLALGLFPLRNLLVKSIDSVFMRNQSTYRNRLQTFGRELTRAIDLKAIVILLRQYVLDNLHPVHLHIFTRDPLTDQYRAFPEITNPKQTPTTDLRFHPTSALVATLATNRTSINLGETRIIPENLKPDKPRMSLLESQLYVPIPGGQSLIGWLAIGSKSSGEAYTAQDLEFLESLCDQAALAIERAQVIADMERRVHAMNVLTRISQGVNVTLAFDDILELIYAQTNQIIPTRDFQITLYDRLNDFVYPVFFLENDERDAEREKHPIPVGHGLERDVISERRSIACDDYEHECKLRDSLPFVTGIYAWLGVPLNTGAETIGILSIASRDPNISYTNEQAVLLQAIADQAAGAIVKARLLEDAERRARHLSKLNEVARSLSSMLALEPLLEQILNSAVEILNCESGSLLLLEEETGFLVLKAAYGPDVSNVIGLRIPKGSGLISKSVDTRLPIIHNDISRSKDWSMLSNQRRKSNTHDILVVPLQVNERVLGVIEIINRKDGLPFTPEDQDLLIAFTSQAAVALENARLYTLTDQSLADRVEELSVMQRIDRELNISLDINRAMQITLEWAMRQSNADAGLVGMIDAGKIAIMASQGYSNELDVYPEALMPIELPSVMASISSGQPQWIYAAQGEEDLQKIILLNKGKSQAVIPIRREKEVIGILILERFNPGVYPPDIQAFLSRLSDHAAIAISNARLFAEVQAANLAKSDFVSFVSHELKTPMTSIKGFSDLLAAGVVGPINEAQAHFLNTIRANIDRMTNLVSDLADTSRIETGRLRLDFAPVEVAQIVNEVIHSAQSLIAEKRLNLIINVEEDLPPVWGDHSRLIQILTNLINNAYKYTPSGGEIEISAELSSTTSTADNELREIHITVKDNGIGITPENQKKIFQKFFRADDPKVRDIPGTGLGLNITKTLVEMQGGKIWFESIPDVGTIFHFSIPVVEGM